MSFDDLNNIVRPVFKDLGAMAPASVSGLTTTLYQAVVKGKTSKGKHTSNTISIEAGWESVVLLRAYIAYLQSANFHKLSPATRYSVVRVVDNFFTFVMANPQFKTEGVPMNIFAQYVQYLRKTTRKNGNSVAESINLATKPLRELLLADDRLETAYWHEDFPLIVANIPSFTKNPKKPVSSLVELFSSCPYDNDEMITSLRLVCCWLIEQLGQQRNQLLNNTEVQRVISESKSRFSTTEVPFKYYSTTYDDKGDWARDAYGLLVRTVLDTGHSLLIERLYYNDKAPSNTGSPLTVKDMCRWLEKWVIENNSQKLHQYFMIENKKHKIKFIQTLTLAHLARPCDAETFAMQCLLASERIQSSGLQQHSLADFAINKSGVQADYDKGRRNRRSATNIYKRNTLIHDTFTGWCDVMLASQDCLSEEQKGLTLAFYERTKSADGILNYSKIPMLPFILLVTPDTLLYRELDNEIGEEAQPFLWLLERIIRQNDFVARQERKYDKAYNGYKKDKRKAKPTRSAFVSASNVGLSPNSIAKSRQAMDDGVKNVRKKGVSADPQFNDEKVSAELTGHTPETKKNIYQNRSSSPEMIRSMRTFAAEVGDLMIQDVEKIRPLMEKTQVIDLDEACKLLGLTKPIEGLNALLDELDNMDIGLFGEVALGDQTIIITTELTAALIIGYIQHINKEIPSLRLDDDSKALQALSRKFYLQAVLDEFPEHLKVAGKTMADEHEFPYPSLI